MQPHWYTVYQSQNKLSESIEKFMSLQESKKDEIIDAENNSLEALIVKF